MAEQHRHGKYRKVDSRIWNDAKFASMSDNGKLAFLFLLTHPHMTGVGAMRATLSGLAEELGWERKAFAEAFAEALSKGMVKHDRKACFVGLPKFIKYNKPESPNVIRGWAKGWDLVPECKLKKELYQAIKDFAEGWGEGYAKAFAEAFPHPSPNQEQEQEQDINSDPVGSDAGASLSDNWLEETLWRQGLAALIRLSGKTENACRRAIGKWRRDNANEKVLYAIARAEKETASDPIAFIEGVLRGAGRKQQRHIEQSDRAVEEFVNG